MDNIRQVSIADSMRKHYVDYAMSVITGRALPDVNDGLKPVQRRVLYSMNELGIGYNKPYKKSARIVGDVLGRFHPHGDASVYDALVRMAQDFSMRYMLVDGHGNFGSVDGDSAAAMRYTEARLTRYGQAMLDDLEKNTVDFVPNFDGEEKEPNILPSLLPNLLLNGTSGIAVGMATNMAPHNANNIYDALDYIIDCVINNEEPVEDTIIDIIQAPDFPTGGQIINVDTIRDAYKNGQGKVTLRGIYEADEDGNIVITEIPYKVNKAKLLNSIANLSTATKEKGKQEKPAVIPEIKEVRDESDRTGMRIFIELKKGTNTQLVINKLLKHTELQVNFSINNTVIVDKMPVVLSMKDLLEQFLAHSTQIIIRRTEYSIEKATKRLNIVDGILKCFAEDMFDIVIETIRTSEDTILALMGLGFNQEQAEYIADMKVRTLSLSSENKLNAEKETLESNIAHWNDILNDTQVLLIELKKDYQELKDKFADDRRTIITGESSSINEEDLVKDETLVITITDNNLIKSVSETEYNTQKRGGKGSKAASTKEDEIIKYMFTTNSKDNIMFFTNKGRVHLLKAYKIPKTNKNARGKSIFNFLSLDTENNEEVVNVIAANTNDTTKSLLMITHNGVIKRLQLDKLSTRMTVTKIIEFKENDSLTAVLLVSEGDNVIINTACGLSIMTTVDESNIRPMGRTAVGVTGMKFKIEGDYVVDMSLCDKTYLFTLTSSGLGKRTLLTEFTPQNRGGKGIVSHKVTNKTGKVIGALTVGEDEDILIVTEQGLMIRVESSSISVTGRSASGVKLLTLNENDAISSISTIIKDSEENEDVL